MAGSTKNTGDLKTHASRGLYASGGKRLFDITISLCGGILLLPVIVIVAVLVRVKLGSPVIFRQVRPGRDEMPFELIKFRSMLDANDENGNPLPDADRLTKFGAFLRSTSLDELPELWNIFRGDMAIVGPRPLLMSYLDLYSPAQRRRHEVRPGLTGLAQVRGRNLLTWPEKFAADLEYVETYSLRMDIAIIARTFIGLIARRGISADGEATMPFFRGNEDEQDGR